MNIAKTEDNLVAVQQAIFELVEGKRIVKTEFVTAEGYKSAKEYTSVSLGELQSLQADLLNHINPRETMQSIDVEVVF